MKSPLVPQVLRLLPGLPASPEAAPTDTHARAAIQADAWFDLGCRLEARSAGLAAEAYDRALACDPRHADAHTNLGRLLHEQGRVREALGHYERAVQLAPADATARFNLGVALQDVGRFLESARVYEAALALDPALADAHSNLALVRERLGDRLAAFRHFAEARRLSG